MGIRENKVETYLNDEVEKVNGITRKWVSPGRDGVPDRIVIRDNVVVFVEVKTSDGALSPAQLREHRRLSAASATVTTVYGNRGVDYFILWLTTGFFRGREYR